jgi:hypothetical protein
LTSRGLATTFEIPIELAEYTGTYVAVVKKDTVQLAVTAQNGKTLSVYTAPSKRSIPLARPAPTNSSASGGEAALGASTSTAKVPAQSKPSYKARGRIAESTSDNEPDGNGEHFETQRSQRKPFPSFVTATCKSFSRFIERDVTEVEESYPL